MTSRPNLVRTHPFPVQMNSSELPTRHGVHTYTHIHAHTHTHVYQSLDGPMWTVCSLCGKRLALPLVMQCNISFDNDDDDCTSNRKPRLLLIQLSILSFLIDFDSKCPTSSNGQCRCGNWNSLLVKTVSPVSNSDHYFLRTDRSCARIGFTLSRSILIFFATPTSATPRQATLTPTTLSIQPAVPFLVLPNLPTTEFHEISYIVFRFSK